jgi:hypothetical protein
MHDVVLVNTQFPESFRQTFFSVGLFFPGVGTYILDPSQAFPDKTEKISRRHPAAFIQSKIQPQPAVQPVIVGLFRDRLFSRADRIVARSVRVQMLARFANIVCGDDQHDSLIRIVRHLLGDNMKGVAIFVRLVSDAISVIAEDIQKVMGTNLDAHI